MEFVEAVKTDDDTEVDELSWTAGCGLEAADDSTMGDAVASR